jgi:hypothetical protein
VIDYTEAVFKTTATVSTRCREEHLAKQKMARKLRAKKGRETYSKRKRIIEPVFGQP